MVNGERLRCETTTEFGKDPVFTLFLGGVVESQLAQAPRGDDSTAGRYLHIGGFSVPTLSPREQEIARLVAIGYPNKTIAGILDISPWTVATHVRRIFNKLGVHGRPAMIAELAGAGFRFDRSRRAPPCPDQSGAPPPARGTLGVRA